MNQNLPTNSENDSENEEDTPYDLCLYRAVEQLPNTTSLIVAETLATQMLRMEEASKRIAEEGIVVRDLKGSVIPHPAIKIEHDAAKVVADIFKKFKK